MALLERVATLVRANLNDLIDKAEDPEKMIKQVILDMQNQLLQVKTQVAIAIADQHVLEAKHRENDEKTAEWVRKAEIASTLKPPTASRRASAKGLLLCASRTLATMSAQPRNEMVTTLRRTMECIGLVFGTRAPALSERPGGGVHFQALVVTC